MKIVALLLSSVFLSNAYAGEPNFKVFCNELLQRQPRISDYSAHFSQDFQKAVPLESLTALFSDIYSDAGSCVSFKTTLSGPNKYLLTLTGDNRIEAVFSASFDPSLGVFNGFMFAGINDPAVQVKSWKDLESALEKLEGSLSASLVTSDNRVKHSYNDSEVFAVGSTFKLYILGALEQSILKGQHRWEELLPIHEEWKSLPSGIMHTWPSGQKVTLYEHAEKMISVSDNTATDHLLYFLGRGQVENILSPMGNSSQRSYLPFLSTLEMFKLKWAISPASTQDYLQKDRSGRLAVLENLKEVARTQVGTNGIDYNTPFKIDTLEWFATTQENCKAMFWLASRNSPQIRSILAKNVPFVNQPGTAGSHWSYAGYKGGSEPGVISMTFLLESKQQKRACLSMSWNNPNKNVSKNRLMDIVKKTLSFAETQIP